MIATLRIPNLMYNLAGYDPNKPAAGSAGALFFLLSVALFLRLSHRRDWWGLCLPIGVFCKLVLLVIEKTYHLLFQATALAIFSALLSIVIQIMRAFSL